MDVGLAVTLALPLVLLETVLVPFNETSIISKPAPAVPVIVSVIELTTIYPIPMNNIKPNITNNL